MVNRLAPDPGLSKHWQVNDAVRKLLIDLRLQLAGKSEMAAPITQARLDEISDLLNTLAACQEDIQIKY